MSLTLLVAQGILWTEDSGKGELSILFLDKKKNTFFLNLLEDQRTQRNSNNANGKNKK